MFAITLNNIDRLVIYGDGEKLMEKNRDFAKIGRWEHGAVHEDYFSRILAVNLSEEPKTARKENLNRKDSYLLPYRKPYGTRGVALYVHTSEVLFENLGEYLDTETNGEKCFLYAFRVVFKHGALADVHHFEKMNVSGDWTLPEGATWDNGRNYYRLADDDALKLGRKLAEKRGETFTEYNVIHHWYTTETIAETVYKSEGFHKIEKDDARKEREKLAAALNAALGREKFSHYDIADLLKVADITLKNAAEV